MFVIKCLVIQVAYKHINENIQVNIVKPYKYDVCDEVLNHTSNLQNHQRIHTDDKHY